MYFDDDPLFAFDPIFNGKPEAARERLVAKFSLGTHAREVRARFRLGHRAARPALGTPFEA